jgi:ubiquinone/menaquinone biosynthesis C-methylase UbiE
MADEEQYTPGYAQNASDFMTRRTVNSHAAFLLPHLRPGLRVLDCGCGPGSITCGLARLVRPGPVVGIDREASQVELARTRAETEGADNVTFDVASIYELPFVSGSFDVVFAHAVFEHLGSPDRALAELRRVLAPGGTVALRSPDWGGFIVGPETAALRAALEAYTELQTANGGDVRVGRKLKGLLRSAGFAVRRFSATYEVYESAPVIGEYLASRMEAGGLTEAATVLRRWSIHPDAVFAQAWCEIVGTAET